MHRPVALLSKADMTFPVKREPCLFTAFCIIHKNPQLIPTNVTQGGLTQDGKHTHGGQFTQSIDTREERTGFIQDTCKYIHDNQVHHKYL